jgi:hypothetical protein
MSSEQADFTSPLAEQGAGAMLRRVLAVPVGRET